MIGRLDDVAATLDAEIAGDWPAPQPLITEGKPEPYPLDVMPDTLRGAIAEVQTFTKAPPALVASCALAAMSTAAQAYIDVCRADKLQGPSGLYLLTVADSGERKTTVDGFFTGAIREYERETAEAAAPELADHRARFDAWESIRAGLRDKIRSLAKDSKPTAATEAALAEHEHGRPEPPRVPRLLYADATPEALAHSLARQWPSGGVLSSEAGAVFGSHGMGRDSIVRNLSLLNVLWDGGALTVDRRTAESFTVHGARLSMGLQVQESPLRDFFRAAGQVARGSGFLARFLICWPASTQGTRAFTEPPQRWPALARFHQRVKDILIEPAPVDDRGALVPRVVTLDAAAKRSWIDYHDAIERELGERGELRDLRDVAAKSADNVARLAALFQYFETGGLSITAETIERAQPLAAWHLSESRRLFSGLALPGALHDAARLDTWIIGQGSPLLTRRAAQQFGPLRDGERLDAAINELEQLDRVRRRLDGKRVFLLVNPALVGL